jgi:hypothetical protein
MTDKIKSMISHELLLHPKAQLLDIFKLYMQSAFGPGHLIPNIDKARDYLLAELNENKQYTSTQCLCLILPCDAFYPLARYSLDMIRNKSISFDDYFDAFIKTANSIPQTSDEVFIDYWYQIIPWLETLNKANFEADKMKIENLIYDGHFLVSHSEVYRVEYQPAYRVINMSLM